MLALVDDDVITYASGFSSETKTYELKVGDEIHVFRYKKEVDEWIQNNLSSEESYELEVVNTIPPVSHSLHNARQLLEKILERVGAKDYKIYLTGKNNFRDKVATIRGYKAHRDKLAKPVYYDEIKRYLIDTWNAEVVDDMEADDAMAIKQMEHYEALDDWTCICSIDKDLDQVPGWHYNWMRDDMYQIKLADALRYYAKQMLTGDSTDNILGIPGIGPKKADKILENVKDDDLIHVIQEQYKNSFTEEFKKKHGVPEHMSWEDIFNETDLLIRIKWSLND